MLSISGLSGCSHEPVRPSVTAVVDTLGPMPLMQNPALLPAEGDPRFEQARAAQADFQSQLRELDRGDKDHEAMELCRKFVEQQKRTMGPDSPFVGMGYSSLGKFANRARDWATAESALREALRLKSMYLGDGCLDTAVAVHDLVGAMMGEGKVAEASDLLNRYWASAQKQPPSLAARVYYLHTLAWVASVRGNREQAAAYASEAVSLKRSNAATVMLQPTLSDLLSESARYQMDLGRYDGALATLTEYCKRHYDKKLAADEQVLQMLVQCARDAESKHNIKQAQLAIKSGCDLMPYARVNPGTRQDITTYALRLGVN